jgi:hypothetical protein
MTKELQLAACGTCAAHAADAEKTLRKFLTKTFLQFFTRFHNVKTFVPVLN